MTGTVLDAGTVALNKTDPSLSEPTSYLGETDKQASRQQLVICAMKKNKAKKGSVCDGESYFSEAGKGGLPCKGIIWIEI